MLYQYTFAFKAQSYELKMFLNGLKRGLFPLQQSYELKSITRIVHRTFNAKVTDDFFQIPLPADQQLGRQQFSGVVVNQ